MDWEQLLASTTRSVDEELRLRNAYLAVENRLLRHHITGRVQLTDAERKTLAEMGQKLGKKVLEEIGTIAQPETILACIVHAFPRQMIALRRVNLWDVLVLTRYGKRWWYAWLERIVHRVTIA